MDINGASSPVLSDVCHRSLPRWLMIVLSSVHSMLRTDGDSVWETRRTSCPSLEDTQRPRPLCPGSVQEKAKCLLSGAQVRPDGLEPVIRGDAKMSSRVSGVCWAVASEGRASRVTAAMMVSQREAWRMGLLWLRSGWEVKTALSASRSRKGDL